MNDPNEKPTDDILVGDAIVKLNDLMPHAHRLKDWQRYVDNLSWCGGDDCCEVEEGVVDSFEYAKKLCLSAKDVLYRKNGQTAYLMTRVFSKAAKCGHCNTDDIHDLIADAINQTKVSTGGRIAVEHRVTPEIYYDVQRRCFWVHSTGGFVPVDKSSVVTELNEAGFCPKSEIDGGLSEVDREIMRIQRESDVDFGIALSGHQPGVIEANGNKVLITRGSKLIEPREGSRKNISRFINNLFGKEQKGYVLAALRRDYIALRTGQHVQGQANFLAGVANCGKTLFINMIVIPLLGGTYANAYEYLSGRTNFNGDWAGASVLLVDDEVAHADMESRRAFGARIKKLVSTTNQFLHDKGLRGMNLRPFWRVWVAVNDEPESLRMLPPMCENLPDKVNLYYCQPGAVPMSTDSPEERKALADAIAAELPAFCYALVNWKVPSGLSGGRFLVPTFHNIALMAKLTELAPETALLSLIDQCKFGNLIDADPWEASLAEIEFCLRQQAERQFERACNFNGALGTFLGRLKESRKDRVIYDRKSNRRRWIIMPPTTAD